MMRRLMVLPLLMALGACGPKRAATYVELLDDSGQNTYVAGAAGSGLAKGVACEEAVGRAVVAMSEKFVDENDDLADDVAEAVGVEDGKGFLLRFARAESRAASVQDVDFDPIDHLCMATVRWKPPLFVKDAVVEYAERLRRAEVGAPAAPAAPAPPSAAAPTAPSAPPPPPASAATPPPAPVTAAPPPPAPASPAAPASAGGGAVTVAPPACGAERKKLEQALGESRGHTDKLAECLRRTSNDETVCVRYKMWVDKAKQSEAGVAAGLSRCLNASLPTSLRQVLEASLPGHAGRSIETRADGTLIVWTYSPADETAYVLEVSSDGRTSRSGLAANQLAWLREQLGL